MFFLVAVVACLVPLAFRFIFNHTLTIFLRLLVYLQFLSFVSRVYRLALSGNDYAVSGSDDDDDSMMMTMMVMLMFMLLITMMMMQKK